MRSGRPRVQHKPSPGGTDILLIEDDPRDAELTLEALKQCGVTSCEHVSDGPEALDYLACKGIFANRYPAPPKLILLDLRLQKMSGIHVLRQVKSDHRTKRIPIVALTSSQLLIELAESYQLGVNSYVIKPTDARTYAERVGEIAYYWLVLNEPPPNDSNAIRPPISFKPA